MAAVGEDESDADNFDPGRERRNRKPSSNGSRVAQREKVLDGTTLKVYRLLYKEGRPMGIHDIQRSLGFSSPSVSQYHIKKLLQAGLIKEESKSRGTGYVVDKLMFENMIRVKRSLIPIQTSYIAFFIGSLILLLLISVRSHVYDSTFLLALITNIAALFGFSFEALKSLKKFSD